MLKKKIQQFILLTLCSFSVLSLSSFLHYGPAYCRDAANAIDTISISIAKENDLTYIGEGMGSSIGANKSTWASFYTCLKKLTIEEACALAGKAQTALLDKVYEQSVFDTYYQESNKNHLTPKPEQVSENSVATKIAFWDENVDRPMHPYLAEIRVIGEEFLCYYADPKTQALEAPLIRPFHYVRSEPKKVSP